MGISNFNNHHLTKELKDAVFKHWQLKKAADDNTEQPKDEATND